MSDLTFDLIVFDLDGVLVDTSSAHSKAFKDIWRRVGVVGPPYDEIAGMSTSDAIRKVCPHFTDSQIQHWESIKQVKLLDFLETDSVLFGDTIACLQALKKHQFRMALATSASQDRAKWTLEHYQLSSFFSLVATSGDSKRGKPFPDVYLKVMKEANIAPDRTLIVEDSLAGLRAGLASHAFVASLRSGIAVIGDRFIGRFNNLEELLRYLKPA